MMELLPVLKNVQPFLKGSECESSYLTHLCPYPGPVSFHLSLLSSIQIIPGNSFNSGSQQQTVITIGAKLPETRIAVYRYGTMCVA